MDKHGYCHIGDFGFSKILKEDEYAKTIVGTPDYVSPEIL